MALPLEGIRVVDFTQVFAGPTCTRILADLGADVIKIEARTRADITRSLIIADNDGRSTPWNRGSYFVVRNAGKRDVTLDLNDERGRALARRLIEDADVVAESFTPRVMANFGLDYERIREFNPDVIMISLSGYGQDGPYRDYSAYGMGLEPASGISQQTGYPGGPPMRSGLSFTDPLSGFLGAGAVLLALEYRRRTGKGQYIDLSEQEAAIGLVAYALMETQMNGRLPERRGNRSWFGDAPQGVYPCAGRDRWVAISVASDEQWEALCDEAGHPEWKDDPRFADILSRNEHQDALDEVIASWTRGLEAMDVARRLQARGVRAAPVLDGRDILFDPHFRERRHFDVIDQPAIGRRPVQRHLAAKFTGFEAAARGHAPLLGEHNRDVLQGLLGISDEEYAELEASGVIGDRPALPVPGEVMSAVLKLPYDAYLQQGILLDIDPDYEQRLGLA